MKQSRQSSKTRGFSRASSLMQSRIRSAGETRGFAVTRLLTHWAEIVGDATAGTATPVNVTYGRGNLGATLTLLTTGANAPMVEMQKEQIRDKVNGCYGYKAIERVRITQTAPTGFHEGRVVFAPAPKSRPSPDPQTRAEAADISQDVQSEELRTALAALGANVLSKTKS